MTPETLTPDQLTYAYVTQGERIVGGQYGHVWAMQRLAAEVIALREIAERLAGGDPFERNVAARDFRTRKRLIADTVREKDA